MGCWTEAATEFVLSVTFEGDRKQYGCVPKQYWSNLATRNSPVRDSW